jgi:parallel beta-helix repeat protein
MDFCGKWDKHHLPQKSSCFYFEETIMGINTKNKTKFMPQWIPIQWRVFLGIVLTLSIVGLNYSIAAATGVTYYVDNTNPSCTNTGTGTSSALPFCTISKGASVAVAGDVVRVLAGSYAETVTVPFSGSNGLSITYTAAPGVTVTGNGQKSGGNGFYMYNKSYVTIDGFTITGTADRGIYVFGSNHITISNNHVSYSGSPASGSTRAGIYINSTTNSTISGNTSDHNSFHGIHLTNGANNNLVSNNIMFGNAQGWQRDASGIRLDGSGTTNNTILHNISYGNEDSGITNYTGASGNFEIGNLLYGNGDHGIDNLNSPNNTVIGNTVHGNVTAGINFEGTTTTGSSGATVYNNIMVDNGLRHQVGGGTSAGQPSNLRFDSTSLVGDTLDYNLFYLNSGTALIQWNGTNYSTLAAFKAAVSGQETHGLQVNPLFVVPAPIAQRPASAPYNVTVNVGDYHIQAGSPAIDSAYANAPSEPILDLDGNPRLDDPTIANTGVGARTYDDRGVYEYQPPGVAPTPTNTSLPTVTTTPQPPTFTPTITFTPTPTVPVSSLTFIANADSYVREASSSNYGTSAQLWMDGDVGASYSAYLKFTVSGIAGTVQNATLRVYSTSGTVDGPPVFATANDWTETGINGNTLPALTSSVLDDKGAIASGVWTEYNVTAQIAGDGTYSFAFIPTSTDAVSFSSREGSQPPQLVITIAP